MLIVQMEGWNLRRREICFCTVRYLRLPSQKTMIITMIPEAFPAVVRVFPERAVITKSQGDRYSGTVPVPLASFFGNCTKYTKIICYLQKLCISIKIEKKIKLQPVKVA